MSLGGMKDASDVAGMFESDICEYESDKTPTHLFLPSFECLEGWKKLVVKVPTHVSLSSSAEFNRKDI